MLCRVLVASTVAHNLNITFSCQLRLELEKREYAGECPVCPLNTLTLHRLWQAGVPPGWCSPQPEDTIAPLKATIATQDNRLSLFFPNPHSSVWVLQNKPLVAGVLVG